MNKRDLVDAIAKKTGGTKASVEARLKAVLDTVTATLAKGGKVAIIGFGTFSTSRRAARTGRNPVTGAAIKIPAAKVTKFSAGAGAEEGGQQEITRTACAASYLKQIGLVRPDQATGLVRDPEEDPRSPVPST